MSVEKVNILNAVEFEKKSIDKYIDMFGIMGDKKGIKLSTNKHGIKTPPYKWKVVDDCDFDNYEEDPHDFAIFTGEYFTNPETNEKVYHDNNILVLDLDFYNPKNNCDVDNHPFTKAFPDFVTRFNTFTIRTKSGGYHVFFKYNDVFSTRMIKDIAYDDKILDIDILTNDSFVYTVGTKLKEDHDDYKIEHLTDVKEMPYDLKMWIIKGTENKFKLRNKPPTPPPPTQVTTQATTQNKILDTDKELNDICNNIDYQYIDNYQDWLKIVWACASINNEDLARNISMKSSKFNESSFQKVYHSYEEGKGITKACLYYYSKQSNQTKHFKTMKKHHKYDEIETPTDAKLAETFCKFYGNNYLICDGKQYHYNGYFWDEKSVGVKIRNQIRNDLSQIYIDMIKPPTSEEVMKKNKQIQKILDAFGNATKCKHIYEVVCDMITNDEIKFNEKPNIFCFKNKVYDLHLNDWIEPNRYDYINQSTRKPFIKPSQQTTDELKEMFVKIFPNEETRKCYMTILATGLYGKTLEKITFSNGSGRNGKGFTNSLMLHLLGDYGAEISPSVLLQKKNDGGGCNAELASMADKRLCIFPEPDEDKKINISVVKDITGGRTLKATKKYSNKTTHNLFATSIIECNQKPKLSGEINTAIKERLIDLEFVSTFTSDPSQYEGVENVYQGNNKVKTVEYQDDNYCSLFLILIPYWKRYYNDNQNLIIPKHIIERNNEYMQESDAVYQWFIDNYQRSTDKKKYVQFKDVFNKFKCSDNRPYVKKEEMNQKNIKKKLINNEFLKSSWKEKTSSARSIFIGWEKKPDDEDDTTFNLQKISQNHLDML